MALILTTSVGGGIAWWLQASRVAAKEQERAAAAAELASLASRVQSAEATAASATQELRKAQSVAESATRQATESAGQIDALRRDAAGVRAERDESRAAQAALKADLERARANDLDPGVLPQMDLAGMFGGNAQFRTLVDCRIAGSAVPGVDRSEAEKALDRALVGSGLKAVSQGPFRVAVFVSIGGEKPRRSMGVMMLVMRIMKVPGEAGSREVAVWGQQRTSAVSDAEASGQLRGLLEELCGELASVCGAKASVTGVPVTPASPAQPATPAPAPTPANAPTP
jgi:hypothetical protein